MFYGRQARQKYVHRKNDRQFAGYTSPRNNILNNIPVLQIVNKSLYASFYAPQKLNYVY